MRRSASRRFAWRLKQELAYPTTPVRRRLADLLVRTLRLGENGARTFLFPVGLLAGSRHTLYVVYDLSVNPITYDLGWTIVAAELDRRARGFKSLHFVFILPRQWNAGFESDDYHRIVDDTQRAWRFHSILLPMIQLIQGPSGVSVFESLAVARLFLLGRAWSFYPRRTSILLSRYVDGRNDVFAYAAAGHDCHCLAAPLQARRYVEQWLEGRGAGRRKLVVITLRQSDYMPARNSDLSAWAGFAASLDPVRYVVAIVPDTDKALDFDIAPFAGTHLFTEAAFDVRLRMALYERAWLNMGVNTGPFVLCYFGNTRFIQVKKIVEEVPQASSAVLTRLGFVPRRQPPFLGPDQRIAWDASDSLTDLKRVFAFAEQSKDPCLHPEFERR